MNDHAIELPFKHLGKNVSIYDPCIVLRPEAIGLSDNVRVDSMTKLEGGEGVYIGLCVHISSFCHVNIGGGETFLGDYSAMASGAKIISGSNQCAGLSMSAAAPKEMQVVERSRVIVGKYAFLGANCTVLPGVTIGEGAVIGAGAVVTKDVPAWAIVVGVPAKVISERQRSSQC